MGQGHNDRNGGGCLDVNNAREGRGRTGEGARSLDNALSII